MFCLIKKMYVLDMILLQTDRNPYNWGIIVNEKDKIVELAPLFDNSNICGMNKDVCGFYFLFK